MQTIVLEHEFQFKPLKLLQLQLITAVQTSFLTVQTCLLAFHRKCVRNRYTLQQNVTMRPNFQPSDSGHKTVLRTLYQILNWCDFEV